MTIRQQQRSGIRPLVVPGRDTDLIGLDIAELQSRENLDVQRVGELVVVVLSGVMDITVNGNRLGQAGGRRTVFEGPGHALYAPPSARVSLTAMDEPTTVVLATAPPDGAATPRPRLIAPHDQEIAERGTGNFSRHVRTILGPGSDAGRLLVGETINPPGNWSSYPPHKHDADRPAIENRFEEVYFFKVHPPGGFGVQIRYQDSGEECFLIRDGDVSIIRAGYHPVAAAPGYALYYLWVMAGEGRQPIAYFDPAHAWVEGRK